MVRLRSPPNRQAAASVGGAPCRRVAVLVTLGSMASAVKVFARGRGIAGGAPCRDLRRAPDRAHCRDGARLRAGGPARARAPRRGGRTGRSADPQDIRTTASDTATQLAGGVKNAFVDVLFGMRPTITAEDAVVVGGGDVGAWMTGELRRQGRLGRPGASRTIVVPLVVQGKLAGVIRVTGRRPLANDLHQALQTLASQVEQSLESAVLADDLLARQSEARFRSLVQNSRDLIAVVERDLTVRYATPSVESMLVFRRS